MLDEDLMSVLASIIIDTTPVASYVGRRNLIVRDIVLKSVEEGEEPLLKYMAENNRVPLHSSYLTEESYAMCSKSAVYVGTYPMEVPAEEIVKMPRFCREFLGAFHTHPVPIHIPTPYDVIDAYQLKQKVECVGINLDGESARILCLSPHAHQGWLKVAEILSEEFFDYMVSRVSQYLVVMNDLQEIYFLPSPTYEELIALEEYFVRLTKDLADIAIVAVNGNSYTVKMR
ncbi:MAG: hypothetical protein DRO12_00255 [Thermoprotei archaeon]|nr:MAG: hypothetical protein DRO12_00255 [Thermoprotei archaeon]